MIVLVGCGYALTRLALDEVHRGAVLATTRDPARAAQLRAAGVEVRPLDEALVRTAGADVAVALPPDAGLDARLAAALAAAPPARLVYLSSTGVYGAARGEVDEETPVDRASPEAGARLRAEEAFCALGGVALRAAGIYGPGRGLHLRLLAGSHRLTDGGRATISRVHVEDLARAVRCALDRGPAGGVLCAADDAPVPQREVVAWLCARLALPLPPSAPAADVPATLRGDRAVRNARLRALGWAPRYPTYREGFAALLAAGEAVASGPPPA